jgi:hypothetical protein
MVMVTVDVALAVIFTEPTFTGAVCAAAGNASSEPLKDPATTPNTQEENFIFYCLRLRVAGRALPSCFLAALVISIGRGAGSISLC